jgi:hypothetical protein
MVSSCLRKLLAGLCILSVFAISSCLFPTGVTTTSFWLALILASVLFVSDGRRGSVHDNEPLAIYFGYALITYLALVSIAQGADIDSLLVSIFEYRIFFLIPLVGLLLYKNEQTRNLCLLAFFLGAFIALTASYLIYFDILNFEDGRRSLANRIFHGFLMMSLFIFVAGLRSTEKYAEVSFSLLLVLITYNVLAVETGRTAYICQAVVGLYFLFYKFKSWQLRVIGSMLCLALVTLIGIVEPDFVAIVGSSVSSVANAVFEDSYSYSAGLRAEYYRGGFHLWADSPIFGVGISNISEALSQLHTDGVIRVFTDNLHSEYLTMLVGGGIFGLALYCIFLFLFWKSFRGQHFVEITRGFALDVKFIGRGIVLIIAVFSLFNSTFKDFGEKQLMLFILPFLLCTSKQKDCH